MDKQKENKLQNMVAFLCFLILGGVCGGFIGAFLVMRSEAGKTVEENLFMFLLLFLIMYVGIFLQIIIHEAGHFVFGLLTGYTFTSFRIGSFIFIKRNGKIEFRRYTLAGTGGQCLMGPPDLVDGKMPVVLYNMGGAIMNLITGLICIPLYLVCGGNNVLSIVLIEFAIIGIGYAAINGVPMRMGTINNDGHNAISIGKDREAVRAFWLQLKMNQMQANGATLASMPEEWFTIPSEEAMKNSLIAAIGFFSCNRLMEKMEFEKADQQMKDLLEMNNGMVGIHRTLLTIDRIYCELVNENRPEVLKELMDKMVERCMKVMKKSPSILRTKYAYALLYEKNAEKAEKLKKEFEEASKSYAYPKLLESEIELMEYARSRQ